MIGAFGLAAATAGHRRRGGPLYPEQSVTSIVESNAFNAAAASFPLTSGAGWCYGDSITLNNQTFDVVALAAGGPYGYSDLVNLKYHPTDDTVSGDRWPAMINSLLTGTITNAGQGGEISTQIVTRYLANSTALSSLGTLSMGTNDNATTSEAGWEVTEGNLDSLLAAHADKPKLVVMPYNVRDVSSYSGEALGGLTHAQMADAAGATGFNWYTASLRKAHDIEADSGATGFSPPPDTARNEWLLNGELHDCFMAIGTGSASGSLDGTHPGPVFSNAISGEVARLFSALSGGAPFVHIDSRAVDWSLPQGSKLCDIKISGGVSYGYVANAALASACYYRDKALWRGAGSAPAGVVDCFLVVQNAVGEHSGRVTLGPTAGYATFGKKAPLVGYRTRQSEHDFNLYEGTINLCFDQNGATGVSRYMKFGSIEIQLRGSNKLMFRFPADAGGDIITTAAAGGPAHVTISWFIDPANSANNLGYWRVNNGSSTTFTITRTTPLNFTGSWTVLGDARTSLMLDGQRAHHMWVADSYLPSDTDMTPIAADDGTSNMSASSIVVAGVTPLIAIGGGAGNWMTGRNWGSLSDFVYHVPWSAADSAIS